MAGLASKYDKRLRAVLGYRAVWEPGSTISLGDIVTLKKGTFVDIDRLSDHHVTFRKEKRQEGTLTLNAQRVKETLIQGDVEIPSAGDLKPSVKADLKLKFGGANTYHLKTAKLSGEDIGDLAKVGRQITTLSDWSFRDYWVVWRVLKAKDFTFLGSIKKNREITISGSGKSIAKYLDSGVSVGVTKTSRLKLDLEMIGAGGSIAIGVTRFKKNGRPRDV